MGEASIIPVDKWQQIDLSAAAIALRLKVYTVDFMIKLFNLVCFYDGIPGIASS